MMTSSRSFPVMFSKQGPCSCLDFWRVSGIPVHFIRPACSQVPVLGLSDRIMAQEKSTDCSYDLTRKVFLHGICLIYLIAFSSLYVQLPGLYGSDGLEPVQIFLNRIKGKLGTNGSTFKDASNLFGNLHTLVWFHAPLNLSVDGMLDLLCVIGIACSVLGCIGFTNPLVIAAAWFSYLSLYFVGQTFLSFQWDILLHEAGWAAIWLSNWHSATSRRTSPPCSLLLIRWMLFKLMFMSGVVKIQANCPTWLNLTACHYHFATQCIPTPLAWYFHNFPGPLLKWMVAMTYLVEIPLPFLALVGLRYVRLFCGVIQILFQVSIILTGNYTFFNILTALLCVSLLDDRVFTLFTKNTDTPKKGNQTGTVRTDGVTPRVRSLQLLAILGFLAVSWVGLFKMAKKGDTGEWDLELKMRPSDLQSFVNLILPWTIGHWMVVLILSSVREAREALKRGVDHGRFDKVKKIFKAGVSIFPTIMVLITFLGGIASILTIETGGWRNFAANNIIVGELGQWTNEWHLASGYGLFRRMTGVGDNGRGMQSARPELEYLGSFDGENWVPIEFKFKPGTLSKPPQWVAPHQPRLDWQMWFAALGSYRQAPWSVHLVQKLLEGSQSVWGLLGDNPQFEKKALKFVKVERFEYEFTRAQWGRERLAPNGSFLEASGNSETSWWVREQKGSYLPQYKLGDLDEYLSYFGWTPKTASNATVQMRDSGIEGLLTLLRSNASVFVWSCILLTIFLMVSNIIKHFYAQLSDPDGGDANSKSKTS